MRYLLSYRDGRRFGIVEDDYTKAMMLAARFDLRCQVEMFGELVDAEKIAGS